MSEVTVEELQEKVHQLEENLRKVKSVDELTGLYNRNTYYDRVRCRFENEPDREYVIVCFDVEKFKFVNDRFGFVEGDDIDETALHLVLYDENDNPCATGRLFLTIRLKLKNCLIPIL